MDKGNEVCMHTHRTARVLVHRQQDEHVQPFTVQYHLQRRHNWTVVTASQTYCYVLQSTTLQQLLLSPYHIPTACCHPASHVAKKIKINITGNTWKLNGETNYLAHIIYNYLLSPKNTKQKASTTKTTIM